MIAPYALRSMYIRRVSTRNKITGESYFTHRLVRTERVGNTVRQITLLNLGRQFAVAQENWPSLCARIDEILSGQAGLLPLKSDLEKLAQLYAAQLLLRQGQRVEPDPGKNVIATQRCFVEVDVDSLEVLRPRSVGVEHVALSVMREIGFIEHLQSLGLNRAQCAAAIGNVIGRMAAPGSELATWGWLKCESALGEILDFDFEAMSLMRLYRASDLLLHHQGKVEAFVFEGVRSLFALESTVTLYDLTNTISRARKSEIRRRRAAAPRRSAPMRYCSPWVWCSMPAVSSNAPRCSPATRWRRAHWRRCSKTCRPRQDRWW